MMKKINMFVATIIRNGGLFCLFVAGIFYAQPLHIFGATPVSVLNGPTAVSMIVNGQGADIFCEQIPEGKIGTCLEIEF